jgi:hypothetical protein
MHADAASVALQEHCVRIVLTIADRRRRVRRAHFEAVALDNREVGLPGRAGLPRPSARIRAEDHATVRKAPLDFRAHLVGVRRRHFEGVDHVQLVDRTHADDAGHRVDVEVLADEDLAAQVFDRLVDVAQRIGLLREARVDATLDVLEQLGVDLLAAERRALVRLQRLGEPGRSEIRAVLIAGPRDDDGRLALLDLLEDRQRPRRGRDQHARLIDRGLAHAELQVVPHLARIRVLRELVEPGRVAGVAAQLIRLLRGVDRRPGSRSAR